MPQQTAIITGTPEQLAQAAQSGADLQRIELSDDLRFAYHDSGPSILEHLARHLGRTAPNWDDLYEQEQQATVAIAAQSPGWYRGELDNHPINEAFQECPSLTHKFPQPKA